MMLEGFWKIPVPFFVVVVVFVVLVVEINRFKNLKKMISIFTE